MLLGMIRSTATKQLAESCQELLEFIQAEISNPGSAGASAAAPANASASQPVVAAPPKDAAAAQPSVAASPGGPQGYSLYLLVLLLFISLSANLRMLWPSSKQAHGEPGCSWINWEQELQTTPFKSR